MDRPAAYRPYQRYANAPRRDILAQLARLRLNHRTWADFRDEQRQNREPVQRAVILRAEHTLLDVYGQLASPMAYANGAYIDIIHRIESQFKMYCMFRALTKAEGLLRIKITWDARYILGKQNVGFIFNFCDVPHQHNSRIHSVLFGLADGSESVEDLAIYLQEMNFEEAVARLRALRVRAPSGAEFGFEPIITTDWMSIGPFIGHERPATQVRTDRVCGWCGCEKGFLQTGWRTTDPFKWHPIEHRPCNLAPSIATTDCRYCPMHGCTRMLCGLLQALRASAPFGTRGTFEQLMSAIRPDWGDGSALRALDMKAFFDKDRLPESIAALFPTARITLPVPGGGNRQLRECDAVLMVLDSVRVFKQFAYRLHPLPVDYDTLRTARTCYLAFYYAQNWQIDPAPHFMTNHFIQFAERDRGAFFALGEGAEHKHHDDKLAVRSTLGRGRCGRDGRSGMQQLLDQQSIRHVLVQLGYGGAEDRPHPVRAADEPQERIPIAPPRFGN